MSVAAAQREEERRGHGAGELRVDAARRRTVRRCVHRSRRTDVEMLTAGVAEVRALIEGL
jgi:hypothetical protein